MDLRSAVFFAIPLAFVGQLAFMHKFGEPYPALMMPRFAEAGPAGDRPVSVTVATITFGYRDHQTRTIEPKELLAPIHVGHHGTIMTNIFSELPATPPRQRAPEGRRDPPLWLFPGYKLGRSSRHTAEHQSSLKAWLRQRASALYQGAAPSRCTVRWQGLTFTPPHWTQPALHAEDLGSFELALDA